MKRVETLTQIAEQIRQLALHAAFVDVIVPAAGIEERYLQSDIRLQKLGDLLNALPISILGIVRAILRLKLRGIRFLQHVNRFKSFRACAAQSGVYSLRIHRFESTLNHLRAGAACQNLELFYIG